MICVIACTNRPNSYSLKIAEYYIKLLQAEAVECTLIDLNTLPESYLFSALYHNQGKDESFNGIKKTIADAEKFIFVVPEYNGSFPGVLKAFIDGLDYPASFKNKKAALLGISSGNMGGSLALSHLTDILNYLGMHVLASKPRITRVEQTFVDGEINDAFVKGLIAIQAKDLLSF
ncbi:NAD(P)H-dependent oxidoreductase [uncultured Cytophaga sp.]|uniref:NADPH-dependent FMN reductase n=1 Tax=uncultured Cytophaga sp. TaxID=160238 RepID=UPI00262BCFC0|nr:NAD(P)H-dependent oxidoreductase [uncultured Cytophaga sp.]